MNKSASNTTSGFIKQSKGGSINPKAALKLDHLQRLASWSAGEGSIPSLAAFFGHKLASAQEALDVPPDPSIVSCQRCETILQPGFNCTIRIEKNRAKARRRSKKPANFSFTQNNVVYTCHFCSERNVKRGTARGHMQAICPPKIRTVSDLKPAKKLVTPKKINADEIKVGEFKSGTPIAAKEIPAAAEIVSSTAIDEEEIPCVDNVDSPTTPIVKTAITLLDSKRKKRNKSASKKRTETEDSPASANAENSASTTNKRRRKSWTSLKELADRNQQKKNIADLSIPFSM